MPDSSGGLCGTGPSALTWDYPVEKNQLVSSDLGSGYHLPQTMELPILIRIGNYNALQCMCLLNRRRSWFVGCSVQRFCCRGVAVGGQIGDIPYSFHNQKKIKRGMEWFRMFGDIGTSVLFCGHFWVVFSLRCTVHLKSQAACLHPSILGWLKDVLLYYPDLS